jgi:hypothetical protein
MSTAVGTITEFGTVEQVSLTAYLIAGRWVPFHKVDGKPAAAAPLVAGITVDMVSASAAMYEGVSDSNVAAYLTR